MPWCMAKKLQKFLYKQLSTKIKSQTKKRTTNSCQIICENEINQNDDLDIEQVFERFYQADASRSSHTTV